MALALYRRYRPDTFAGVIGQDQVTVPLMRALDAGKLTHAYLFSGPRGCGKTSSARILARCVNCAKGPTSHPCGECESCKDLATGGPGSIDVVEIDAASHNGVDDARELRERAGFAPARDRYKIFILDEAHMVTPQGFNALLKIVEEPPEHVMFIFATTEPDKVIGTIRSRTHHYPFRLVPAEVMGPYLEEICSKEGIKAEPGVLKLAMRAGGGSVRDTLSVLDQLMVGAVDGVITRDASVALLGFTPETLIGEAVDAVIEADGEALYGVIQKVVVGGFDPRRFVEDLLARVRDLLVLTLAGDRAESVLSDTAEAEEMGDLHRQAAALGLGPLTAMADIINTTLGQMTGAISPRMRLELLAARLLAGREHGFAAGGPVGTTEGGGMGVPGPSARVQTSAGAGTASASAMASASAAANGSGAVGASHGGGFAGAARNRQGAQNAQGGHGGGFAGAERNLNRGAGQEHGQGSEARPQPQAGLPAGAVPQQRPQHPTSAPQTSPRDTSSNASQTAAPSTPQAASRPAEDDRTPDQKWEALVAALPRDVGRYVAPGRVRAKLGMHKASGKPRLFLRFDKPLSKYAFALAVAAEPVDGTNKVVDILRAEVRKVFGPQVVVAPTPTTDDGQKTPPFSKLPPNEQQKIKAQLLQENLQAAAAKTRSGDVNGAAREPGGQGTSPAQDGGQGSSADDDSHRDRSAAPSPALPSPASAVSGPSSPDPSVSASMHASASSARTAASSLPDDDPWAQPMPRPQRNGGASATVTTDGPATGSASTDAASPHAPEHPHKHVAVPDLSDDTDPWAQPAPARSSASGEIREKPQQAGDPWNSPASSTPASSDPWNAPAAPAVQRPAVANHSAGPDDPVQPDDPWRDVPPPAEPDDPWNTPVPSPFGTGSSPHAASPDPWNVARPADRSRQADPLRPESGPGAQDAPGPQGRQEPQVGADEDEYSMDDESLGSAVAVGRDELRRMFEVKKVETFAPDDPRNPRNIHPAPRHEG